MKICLFCEHFVFDPNTPDWSEYTPGDEAQVGCNRYHWRIYGDSFDENELREGMLKAKTCEDWQVSDFARERGVQS